MYYLFVSTDLMVFSIYTRLHFVLASTIEEESSVDVWLPRTRTLDVVGLNAVASCRGQNITLAG
jgi:hypothetical protein